MTSIIRVPLYCPKMKSGKMKLRPKRIVHMGVTAALFVGHTFARNPRVNHLPVKLPYFPRPETHGNRGGRFMAPIDCPDRVRRLISYQPCFNRYEKPGWNSIAFWGVRIRPRYKLK